MKLPPINLDPSQLNANSTADCTDNAHQFGFLSVLSVQYLAMHFSGAAGGGRMLAAGTGDLAFFVFVLIIMGIRATVAMGKGKTKREDADARRRLNEQIARDIADLD